jgi:hypothetical protein
MPDLVTWLREQLDHDERVARATFEDDGYQEWDTPTSGIVQTASGDLDGLVPARRHIAEHIALHDPARVLRQVKAYREILDEYAYWHQKVLDSETAKFPQPDLGGRFEVASTMVRLVASIYSHRPGYTEATGQYPTPSEYGEG